MTKQARWSYIVLAVTLLLVGVLQLGAPFLALLFSYFVLSKLGRFIPNKWATLGIFILVVVAIGFTATYFTRAAINALPKIADNSIPSAIAWAEEHNLSLPFSDFEGFKAHIMTTIKDQARYLGNFANFARHTSTTLVFIIIAIVCAVSIFFNSQLDLFPETHKVRNNLYSLYCREISQRFTDFYRSFSTVIGAQMTISAINTVLTAIFVFGVGLPYAPVVVGLTFLCGLFPIVGNVLSNTVIVFLAFLVSGKLAIMALIFLVVIHKLEYLLNSKIIGARIRNPIWLTLIGLIIGEKLMGVPGMILSPIILNYVRVEMSKIAVRQTPVAIEEPVIERIGRAG
ncbi:MAG TPA: AI-2E family transporter [Chthoniobacterales bacterium]|jgi:predicted PurR-regulated permease PerM|nr:AI-2E family transporter [Chthoniobacterales bacterium]